MAAAAGRDVANRTVVVQFRLKAMPVPTVHISSANASHEGLEGEPTTLVTSSLSPLSLIPLSQQTLPGSNALPGNTPYPTLCLLLDYLPSP